MYTTDNLLWFERGELQAPDAEPLDEFGSAVALSGRTALVAAPNKDGDAGAVYVFVRFGNLFWVALPKLTASDARAGDQLGTSVAIEGWRVLAGAPFADGDAMHSGAAYLFEPDDGVHYVEMAKLQAIDGERGAQYGRSVALRGIAVASARADDSVLGVDAGAVYVHWLP